MAKSHAKVFDRPEKKRLSTPMIVGLVVLAVVVVSLAVRWLF